MFLYPGHPQPLGGKGDNYGDIAGSEAAYRNAGKKYGSTVCKVLKGLWECAFMQEDRERGEVDGLPGRICRV